MIISLYSIFASTSYLKKLVHLNIFQTSIIFFYLYSGFLADISPLPIVLMLTAVVVSFANFVLGMTILRNIK